jgi:hypothetical protein
MTRDDTIWHETIRYDMTQHDILFMKKRKPDLSRFGLNWLVCVVVCMSRIDMSRLRRWSVYCLTSGYKTWCGFSHYHMEWIELFNCRSDDRSNDRSDGMIPRIVSVKLSNASASVRVSISLNGWSIHLIPNPRFFSSLYYVKRIYTPNKFRSCDHRRFTRVLRCSTNWAIGV